MNWKPSAISLVVLGAMGVLSSTSAVAQALGPEGASDNEWRHSVTPYLFLPVSTQGGSTVDGSSIDLDLDLGDVLDLLQGAASLRYEGWKGNVGVIAEGYYVRLGLEETLPGPMAGSLDVDVRQSFLSFQGAYRFLDGRNASGQRFALDASAGVRWNSITQDIAIGVGPGATLGGTEEWWEPVFGLRYALEISDDWAFGTRAELGGFGVGGNDLQYLLLAGFDWQAWNSASVRLGYQFYGIDFSTERDAGTFAYKVDQHGPYLGLSFAF